MSNDNVTICNYEVLSAWNDYYWKDIVPLTALGGEIEVKLKATDENVFVFPVEINNTLYAIPSKIVEQGKFPIKITNSNKISFRSKVYKYVTKFSSVKIVEKREYSYRTLVNTLCDFKHSHKETDYLIFKLTMLALYLRKGFVRIASDAAFGKSSFPTVLKLLTSDTSIINPRTVPALEYRLLSKFLVLDEFTNLEKSQRDLMQEVLLKIADFNVTYEKSSMGSAKIGTFNQYNIGNLSIAAIYNILDYYKAIKKGDEYFDKIFQYAVQDRFLPLKFDGVMDGSQFVHINNATELAIKHDDDIKKLIKTIRYYQMNFAKELKPYKLYFELPKLSKSGRMEKTFNCILDSCNLYAENENEYNLLAKLLLEKHLSYIAMIEKDRRENAIEEEILK